MIAIIISACLANDPSVCKDYRIPLASGLDAQHCAMYAPPHFARWAEEHPGWKITRWRCSSTSSDDI